MELNVREGLARCKAPSRSFLFSDIEGSTRHWELHRDAMEEALHLHDARMRTAIDQCGGRVFKTVGDAFCAVFPSAESALYGALAAQRAVTREDWSTVGGLQVRMAIHTGIVEERDGDYFGPALNRVARLVAIGHGNQILISATSAEATRDRLPAGASLHDLGLHTLRDLEEPEHVYQLVAKDLPADFPPLRSLEILRGNLPLQLTSFIGRQSQVVEITALLAAARLVTIVGAGGIGKTRTAVQVAGELAATYNDGAWFIDLAPITDSNLVASALASVFDVRERGGSRPLIDEVALALREKTALLILDNCEQVATAAAEAIWHILRHCPKIVILATSREPLRVDGEETYGLPSLSLPPDCKGIAAERALHYEAVALFVSRAKSAQKEFALTDGNAPLVADIVRRLDGIALAIELAAPRVRAFSVRELAKRLDDRLTLLTSGNRTELPRHQTLHALIEWSYELLNEAEQTLFRRLSIFCGNFTLDAAQAVCSDDCGDQEEVPSLISALVEKSLVAPEAGDGEQLYRLLESTRQYAFERLTLACESDSAASRHCRYFVTAAERASNETYEMPTDLWVARHRADLENYRAAIDWGLSQSNDACAGAAIVADLRRLWGNLLPSEGRALLARAMTVVSAAATPRLRGRLVLAAAYVGEGRSGRVEVRADELAQAVLVFAGANDHVRQIDALRMLAFSLGRSGEIAEALARFDEALVLARAFSHPWLVASTLIDLSSWLSESGNRERATNLLDEAMAIYKRQGDRPGIAMALFQMAEMRFAENDVYGALTNVREALAIGRTLSDDRFLGLFLHNKAAYLLAAGDVNEAALCAREALAVALRRGALLFQTFAIEDLAQVNARSGDVHRAARLIGYANAHYARQGLAREFTEQFGYEQTASILQAALPEAQLASLMAEGANLDETTAITEATGTPV